MVEEATVSLLLLVGLGGLAGFLYYRRVQGDKAARTAGVPRRRSMGKNRALLRNQEGSLRWGAMDDASGPGGDVELSSMSPAAQLRSADAGDGDTTAPGMVNGLRVCFTCGRPSKNLCGGCRKVRYCSAECQAAHWPAHSLVCMPVAGGGSGETDDNDVDAGAVHVEVVGGGGGGGAGAGAGAASMGSGLSRWYRERREKRDARRAQREAQRADAASQRAAQRADDNERRAVAAAQKRAADALEQAFERAMAADHPGTAEMQAIEDAIEKADEAGVDELTLSAAERRLKEVESRAEAALRSAAKGRMAEELAAIEATVSKGGDLADRGALALLQLVYDKHPPKKASVSLASLQALDASQHGPIKKALLQAQRDYHPDRNTGTVRETLDRNPAEWEVLCLTICQQLALVYDALFKGDRVMHD